MSSAALVPISRRTVDSMRRSIKRLETTRRSGARGLKWLFSRRWNLAGGFPIKRLLPPPLSPLFFRHVINLVDFFEGVSESVIVMEFAEGDF